MTRFLFAASLLLCIVATSEAGPLRRSRAVCADGSCGSAEVFVVGGATVAPLAAPKPLATKADCPLPLAESRAERARIRQGFAPIRAIRAIWWLLHPGLLR